MANRRIKDLIEPDNFWVYLVVVVLLLGLAASAFSNLILDILTNAVQPQWKWLIQLLVVLVALLILWPIAGLLNLFEALGRSKIAVVGTYPLQETNRGLIVIASVGRGISSAKSAIEFHWNNGQGKLQYCWIISAGDASLASARSLVADLVKQGLDGSRVTFYFGGNYHLQDAADADDPIKVFQLMNRIYADIRKRGLREEEVTADYTGGTKSMTAGMILACVSPDRPLEFMRPRQYDANGQADHNAGSEPHAVTVHFRPLKAMRVDRQARIKGRKSQKILIPQRS